MPVNLAIILAVIAVFLAAKSFLKARTPMAPVARNEQVVTEFARRKRNQIYISIPIAIMVAGLFWVRRNPTAMPYGISPIYFIIPPILITLGLSFWNWRCSSCNAYLGKRLQLDACPSCRIPFK